MSEQPTQQGGYASDVQISAPSSPNYLPEVELGAGWVFTQGGMGHDISSVTAKSVGRPTFVPRNAAQTVYEDEPAADTSGSGQSVY